MKIIQTTVLAVIISLTLDGFTQTKEQNLMKYWKHRSQLDEFILRGEGINAATVHGSYLPAEHRREVIKCGKDVHAGSNLSHFTETYWSDLSFTEDEPKCGGLNIGADATSYLGWYIGVIATEYRLRMNHGTGIEPQEILKELWSALEAYERLDRMAETVLGYSPNLNGYFLRDDVIFNLPTRDDNGNGEPNFPGIGCAIGKFEWKIAMNGSSAIYNDFANDPYDVSVTDENAYDNSPSGDQIKCLLMGLALVKACVDPEATVNGQSVRLKAQNIAHLIGKYAKSRDYQMKNANGNSNAGTTNLLTASYPMAETINWITENNNQDLDLNQDGILGDALGNYHDDIAPGVGAPSFEPSTRGLWKTLWRELIRQYAIYYTDPLPNWPPGGELCAYDALAWIATPSFPAAAVLLPIETMETVNGSCWNLEEPAHLNSVFMNAAISNKWMQSEFRDAADEVGMEIYPLLSDVLYNQDNMRYECKAKCKQMIDLAPCDYFYSCDASTNCYQPKSVSDGGAQNPVCGRVYTPGTTGWQSTNRYEHKNEAEHGNHNCKHNGLDFLLLYNLYHLKYPEELPTYYTNTYSGFIHDHLDYPRPDGYLNVGGVDIWQSCSECEENNGRIWSNGDIWVNSTISAPEVTTIVGPGELEETTFIGDVEYRAGEEITFFSGFEVTNGASMHAYIDPFECESGVLQRLAQEEEEHEDMQASVDREVRTTIVHESDFGVYPNPNTGSFTITGSALQQVMITDATGKLVRQLNGGARTQLQIEGLSSGLYLVRAQMVDGSVENAKVVVN